MADPAFIIKNGNSSVLNPADILVFTNNPVLPEIIQCIFADTLIRFCLQKDEIIRMSNLQLGNPPRKEIIFCIPQLGNIFRNKFHRPALGASPDNDYSRPFIDEQFYLFQLFESIFQFFTAYLLFVSFSHC